MKSLVESFNFLFYIGYKLMVSVQNDKEQSAYLSAIFLSIPIAINLNSIIQIINKILSSEFLRFSAWYIKSLPLLLIIICLCFYFIRKDRYLKIEKSFSDNSESKKSKLIFLSLFYLILTLGLFYFSVKI